MPANDQLANSETNQSNQRDVDQPADGGTATVKPKRKPRTSPSRLDKMPLWKVLLHNDDDSLMEDVVAAIQQIVKMKYVPAMQHMLEAHQRGISLLCVTHREHAELIQEQFETKLLTVTIEPDAR